MAQIEQEASSNCERYSAKYVRRIADEVARVVKAWQARDFIEFWVESRIWPIMKRYEEETERIVRKQVEDDN